MTHQKSKTPLWEKFIGMLGLLLLALGFCYLTWAGLTADKKPATISFHVEKIHALDSNYLVVTKVKNSGSQGAAALKVSAKLVSSPATSQATNAMASVGKPDSTYTERHFVNIDYLPSNSSREVSFFFKENPETAQLQFDAISFQEP